ncbi:MAG: DNA recombination protein RmuC [Neisseria sp.]|uniref:DNA recombination protein RmuC n=1 Tax=Neisseria sp. TaxID=192066 RepID=UPI0026DC59B6|nr:DNA recombination protein RmuC [Neisseria sp.]MDO4640992.1 DNA recombination protein RmuC [Neisseria sp.]
MTDSTLHLAIAAAFCLLFCLLIWALLRHRFQAQKQALQTELAGRSEQYRFANQALSEAETELSALRQSHQSAQNQLAAANQHIEDLQARQSDYACLKQDYEHLRLANERLNTQIEQERQIQEEKIALLQDARAGLSHQFQILANEILEEKTKRFTEQNQENLNRLLHPLNERISGFSQLVQNTYEKETKERLTLENELKRLQSLNTQLHTDAKALTEALVGTQNKTQGNWGEMILESVLTHSGLAKDREYIVQAASTRREEDGSTRRLQPDVLVNLPDGKQIIIDAKVSLTAYVRYTQASTADEAERELAAHIASIRHHIKTLSLKQYNEIDGLQTLDFVFMFIPVEPAYLLALQHDQALFQECFDKRIMLTGPSTLLATLRTVAHLWRNEQQNQNALTIAEEGGRLYDKFVGFVQTLESVGKNIDQAQSQYQAAYKQLYEGRGNLVNRAEKLRKLGIKASKQLDKQLAEHAANEPTVAIAPNQSDISS